MAQEMSLFVARDGSIQFVYDDRLMAALGHLGQTHTQRASHVEPTPDGRQWTADLSPLTGQSLILGPFPTRREALAAELDWIQRFLAECVSSAAEVIRDQKLATG